MISQFQTIKTFSEFIFRWIASGRQLVDQNEANRRAEICVQCHNNVPTSEAVSGGCGSCRMGVLNQFRKNVIGDRRVSQQENLRTCALCGCDNATSTWFPLEAFGYTPSDSNAWPQFCWKKFEE